MAAASASAACYVCHRGFTEGRIGLVEMCAMHRAHLACLRGAQCCDACGDALNVLQQHRIPGGTFQEVYPEGVRRFIGGSAFVFDDAPRRGAAAGRATAARGTASAHVRFSAAAAAAAGAESPERRLAHKAAALLVRAFGAADADADADADATGGGAATATATDTDDGATDSETEALAGETRAALEGDPREVLASPFYTGDGLARVVTVARCVASGLSLREILGLRAFTAHDLKRLFPALQDLVDVGLTANLLARQARQDAPAPLAPAALAKEWNVNAQRLLASALFAGHRAPLHEATATLHYSEAQWQQLGLDAAVIRRHTTRGNLSGTRLSVEFLGRVGFTPDEILAAGLGSVTLMPGGDT